jgi:hypothetical protein
MRKNFLSNAMLLMAMLILPSITSPAQTAEVTFFSNGSKLTPNAPHANHAVFDGWLFDGNQPIGFVQPKHFLTLRLSTGPHIFSASFSAKHPAENSKLQIDLAEGGRYFVRVQAEWRGVLVLESRKGRLDVVTCQIAQLEATNAPSSDTKRIMPEMRDKVVSGPSIPPCR